MKKILLCVSLLLVLTSCIQKDVTYTVRVTYQNGQEETLTVNSWYNEGAEPDMYLKYDEGQACLVISDRFTVACGVRSFSLLSKTVTNPE